MTTAIKFHDTNRDRAVGMVRDIEDRLQRGFGPVPADGADKAYEGLKAFIAAPEGAEMYLGKDEMGSLRRWFEAGAQH